MNGRATRGGQHGLNGEWYEGGQFLPNTHSQKGAHQSGRKGTGKQEIAPYTWSVPPSDEAISIYRNIAGTVAKWLVWQKTLTPSGSTAVYDFCGYTPEQVQELCAAWNTGKRWMTRGTHEVIND